MQGASLKRIPTIEFKRRVVDLLPPLLYYLLSWGYTSCWIKNVILEKTEVSFTMENVLYLY